MNVMDKLIITDIGSTTTKAILLLNEGNRYKMMDYETSPTTVEKPFEDVQIGVIRAVKKLEQKVNIPLLESDKERELKFMPGISYLTTSSAGGGLQILVVGLTKNDSAKSAERTAFGVGGVLLDTIAIDDKRSAIEQMNLFNQLHPDIILMSGGIDDGALFGVIRLAEVLNLSNPLPKFDSHARIPLVFAGNMKAHPFIISLFQDKFDLSLVPNIRPTMIEENLAPATEKIHELFMNNVMEQAPGYNQLKKSVADDIIPTPSGVLKSLQLLSSTLSQNILAFDIGGATTDVYSNILGKYYRTVSANYGMSYSIANVMCDCGFNNVYQKFKDALDKDFNAEDYIKNYIGNKMLNPGHTPQDEYQSFVELIIAIEAIKLSRTQHFKMHFNTKKIGFLDKLKRKNRDSFSDTVYYEKTLEKEEFNASDIKIMIGAGGIISHSSQEQALLIISEALEPKGVTELWRDKHFISPHIGKLSDVDPEQAKNLLLNDCFEKIGIIISPDCQNYKKTNKMLTLSVKNQTVEEFQVWGNDYFFYPNHTEKQFTLNFTSYCSINEENPLVFTSNTHVIIDTRNPKEKSFQKAFNALKPYHFNSEVTDLSSSFKPYDSSNEKLSDIVQKTVSLPYPGEIFIKEGDLITPDTVIGENRYEPPKLYIINLLNQTNTILSEQEIKEGLQIKTGQKLSVQDLIFILKPKISVLGPAIKCYTPVRGIVEQINYETGIIILREIQDYSSKPMTINIAKKLDIKPKHVKGYLKKRLGDFVYRDEALTRMKDIKHPLVTSDYTGTITDIDTNKGTVTITYNKKPFIKKSYYYGKVTNVVPGKSADLSINAKVLSGKIGFGKENGGNIKLFRENQSLSEFKDTVVVYPFPIDLKMLQDFAEVDIKGLICPSVSFKDICSFIGENIGVALTGHEEIPYPVIVTEGFGNMAFSNNMYQILQDNENHYVCLQTLTQIRAGVSRPQMIFF